MLIVKYYVAFLLFCSGSVFARYFKDNPKDDRRDPVAEPSEVVVKVAQAPHKERDSLSKKPIRRHETDAVPDSQTFFPSFSSLFEPRPQNYHLGFGNQETAYSQRPSSYRSLLNYPLFNGFKGFENFGKQNIVADPIHTENNAVLGSGNFGIIKGGTFFAQSDEADLSDEFNSFYNNGHGGPALRLDYESNPRPNYNQDQFANFRDFADINAPSNPAYSHFVVVYANKNSTLDEVSEETKNVYSAPRNIFETLDSLDEPKKERRIKQSKTKAKLERTKLKTKNKKDQWKKNNSKYFVQYQNVEEPLIALS